MNRTEKMDLIKEKHPELFDLGWQLLYNYPGRRCAIEGVMKDDWHFGIADFGKMGFTPVPTWIPDTTLMERKEIANWFNEHILELSDKEAAKIVLSSMARPVGLEGLNYE